MPSAVETTAINTLIPESRSLMICFLLILTYRLYKVTATDKHVVFHAVNNIILDRLDTGIMFVMLFLSSSPLSICTYIICYIDCFLATLKMLLLNYNSIFLPGKSMMIHDAPVHVPILQDLDVSRKAPTPTASLRSSTFKGMMRWNRRETLKQQ